MSSTIIKPTPCNPFNLLQSKAFLFNKTYCILIYITIRCLIHLISYVLDLPALSETKVCLK